MRAVFWIISGIFAVIAVMTQVSADTAMSNLASWAAAFGVTEIPDWMRNPRADNFIAVLSVLAGMFSAYMALKNFRSARSLRASTGELAAKIVKATAEVPKPSRKLPDGRIVVGVAPARLKKLYSEHTTAEADKLSAKYVGNWIELSGPFGDVTSPSPRYTTYPEMEHRMLVTFDHRMEDWGPLVIMTFQAERWQRYLGQKARDIRANRED